MKDNRLALIFSTVWPEPNSSAAGVRQFQWMHFLLDLGYQVILISPSKQKEEGDWGKLDLPEGVTCLPLPLNDSSAAIKLQELDPEIVLFDRFILEEQFGHLVYEACPRALVLLETQDLHLVRRAREEAKECFLQMGFDGSLPQNFYKTETALREISAIERVDHSFVVSSFEEALLVQEFEIKPRNVSWIPFFYDEPVLESEFRKGFQERRDFVWIGNFRHAPNVDGLRWFRNEIWPLIRAKLPEARLRVYGAYPSKEVVQWHMPDKNGISVEGSAPDLNTVFGNARVNLAPLRFGAGIKGKILEGFRFGVPVVTTHVGFEGILSQTSSNQDFLFPGSVTHEVRSFADACVELYQNQAQWETLQSKASELMAGEYSRSRIDPKLRELFKNLLREKSSAALPSFRSRMFRHEMVNSHKYFSKWIEEKEKRTTKELTD